MSDEEPETIVGPFGPARLAQPGEGAYVVNPGTASWLDMPFTIDPDDVLFMIIPQELRDSIPKGVMVEVPYRIMTEEEEAGCRARWLANRKK